MTTITGRLTYLQKIALPPGCTATVSLLDVSRADARATVIARQTIELVGRHVPIRFELVIGSEELDARHRYSVNASIHDSDGCLAWITDTTNPIDVGQDTTDLGEIVLVQASPPRVASPASVGS